MVKIIPVRQLRDDIENRHNFLRNTVTGEVAYLDGRGNIHHLNFDIQGAVVEMAAELIVMDGTIKKLKEKIAESKPIDDDGRAMYKAAIRGLEERNAILEEKLGKDNSLHRWIATTKIIKGIFVEESKNVV